MPDVPSQALLVFVVSTYGAGDPPDNGVSFIDTLQELHEQGRQLSNVRYVMFGLGNSNYTHFNKYAIDTDTLLTKLGATRLGALGLGNDQRGNTEEDFMAWKDEVSRQLTTVLNLQPIKRSYTPRILIRPFKRLDQDVSLEIPANVYQGQPQNVSSTPDLSINVTLPIIKARQLTTSRSEASGSQSSRDCVHLEFSLEDCASVTYETGDYLCISPMNPDREVEALLRLLGVWDNRQEPIDLVPADNAPQSSIRLPTPATFEGLFRYCLDICGPVSRQFLGGLAEFVTDLDMKARIEALASDRHVFYENVTAKRLSLAAVLQGIATPQDVTGEVASNLNIPVSYVLENLKKLQPRNYSISSSALVDPRAVAVTTLAVIDSYEAPADAYHFRGVTSNYLLQLQQEFAGDTSGTQALAASYSTAGPCNLLQGGRVFARIRRSNFKLPPDSSTPIIMVGSGTGIAPFRAFVQERMKLKMQGLEVGKTILVPGHRAPDVDYYHHDVWQEAQDVLGGLFELYPAFSRAQQQPRQYVQDVLGTKSDLVLSILAAEQPGVLYICGSSLMAKGVKEALASIWTQGSEQSSSHARKTGDDWVKDLDYLGCLQEDTWG